MQKATNILTKLPKWALASGILLAASAAADEPAWKAGAPFREQLREIVPSISLPQLRLREALQYVSRGYGIALFLDRRIDPDQQIDFAARNQPLEEILRQLAASAHAEIAIIGSIIYVGPGGTAAQVTAIEASLRQQLAQLSTDLRSRVLKSDHWRSDELSQPRELLGLLARQAGLRVQNAELVPHDLWPAIDLPTMPWSARMTVLLLGFGFTFEIDQAAQAIRLVPAPRAAASTLPPAGAKSRSSPTQKAMGATVYTMRVDQKPLGDVVATMAKSLDKELSYDPILSDKLKQRISFDVKGATLSQLMETALKPLGLSYRITDKSLEIVPARN
jgi:type II secretory pathway component GspD/PulD (secretin)